VSFGNFERAFDLVDIPGQIVNSLIVVALAVPLTVLVASWAGFALSQLSRRFAGVMVAMSLIALMVLITALLVSRFALFRFLGLTNTFVPLVAPSLIGTSPLSPSVNVLDARADTGIIRAGGFEVPVRNAARLGANLQLGIRPEHLRIARDGQGVSATVEVVEIAGDLTFLHLQAGDDRLILRAGPDSRPPVGARLRVEAPPERCYVFDADSGNTLVQAG
jgi:TOBE domain